MAPTIRKTRAAAGRTLKASARPAPKASRASKIGTSDEMQKLISDAVKTYVLTNYDALLDRLAADPAFADMLAEIDRNLDASEQRTARLLAA